MHKSDLTKDIIPSKELAWYLPDLTERATPEVTRKKIGGSVRIFSETNQTSKLGYELFDDKDGFKAHYIEADLLEPSPKLTLLEGKIDIIQITHVMHQWLWEEQIEAAKQIVNYSKQGGLVVGFQVGTAGGTTKERPEIQWNSRMRQDPESWTEMWDVVGRETGTKWKSDAILLLFSDLGVSAKDLQYLGPLTRMLRFVVTRIK